MSRLKSFLVPTLLSTMLRNLGIEVWVHGNRSMGVWVHGNRGRRCMGIKVRVYGKIRAHHKTIKYR